ncbi:MAG: hypothetical protein HY716_18225 [Planctomycetes bacterium]|nr:hypothetical protein [Planctomycetota bacterium]
MIFGAIDVGTNTAKLLVTDAEGRVLLHRAAATRLGENLSATGRLSRAAMRRTLHALQRFRRECEARKVDPLMAVGTEAFRRAANAREFAERCRRETGLPLRILSGASEARLAFAGATADRPEARSAAIDIGGGSTELMTGARGRLREAASLRVGAVTLTESCFASDPPSERELDAARRAIRSRLRRVSPRLLRALSGRRSLIGIGGTCVAIGAIDAKVDERRPAAIHGRVLFIPALERIMERLAGTPLVERRRIRGLDPKRADIIVAGAAILLESVRFLGATSVSISARGLRHGLILECMNSMPL